MHPGTGADPLLVLTAKRARASEESMTDQALSGRDADVQRVAGVDGAAGGWVMAVTGATDGSSVEFSLFEAFADLWTEARRLGLAAVGIDMPIGLPSGARRQADIDARQLLGRRRSSLFWSPPVAALDAADYDQANRASRDHLGMGLAKQAYNLLPKIREVRSALQPSDFDSDATPMAAEVHPELCFAVMAGSAGQADVHLRDGESMPSAAPLQHPKRLQAGIAERLTLLARCFEGILASALTPLVGPPHAALDDVLDAAAAAWTARRVAAGRAAHLGTGNAVIDGDSTGYPLTIIV